MYILYVNVSHFISEHTRFVCEILISKVTSDYSCPVNAIRVKRTIFMCLL